jgi:pimeloyl-ACP methyl ester carboxylesterase
MSSLVKIALFCLVGILGYLGLAFALQRVVLFPRPPRPDRSPAEGRPDVDATWLGPGEQVEAWYLAPAGASRATPTPAIAFTHGNGELIDYWLDEFEIVRSWGVGVLLVEYPGYGRSGGHPSAVTIARTVESAFDYLAARPDVDSRRIVAYGRSVGGGAAGTLARTRPVAALVFESSFTSVRHLARRHGLFGPLVRDPFDNLAAVAAFEGPVLVIHGRDDRLIPPAHGRALAERAQRGELVMMECGHNDCPRPWPELRSFLERQGILGAPSEGGS